jgi:signal transduction histidine kinase
MISDALRLSHLFRNQENQLKQRTVLLVLALIGTFVAYFFFNFLLTNRRVLKSMNDLQEGAKIVGSGDLDYVVPVKHKDEIGDLSQAFNRMTSSLRVITASKIELEREITERLRAEEELRISEARLRAVFNALAEGIIFVNNDGQYEEMNNAVEIIFGYSRDLIADPPLDPRSLLLRGDGTPLPVNEQPSIVALRTGATVRNVEIGAPKSDGTIAWISVNSQPVRDDQGNMLGVVSSLFDITERKRAEEELHQRTLELQQLTETLEARVKERTEELAELSRRLVSAQENERKRISYELHDNVWQNLVAIRFAIENLFSGPKDPEDLKSQSKEIMTALLDTVQRIRTMQGDLWPYVLDDIGLVATLFWYCREFEKHHPGLAVKITDGITETDIPPAHKIVIYRILQEALNNVAKHSRADQVTIRLRTRDHDLEFSIEDNGLGFDPQEAFVQKAPWGGLGLLNIKARTELSGGTFEIESEKGKGTMVRAAWNI